MTLSKSDFLLAGGILVEAVRMYYMPQHESALIASQLETVLCQFGSRADFNTHFPRYHYYFNSVVKEWIKERDFDLMVWHPNHWD
jgi:hypothetical protein